MGGEERAKGVVEGEVNFLKSNVIISPPSPLRGL